MRRTRRAPWARRAFHPESGPRFTTWSPTDRATLLRRLLRESSKSPVADRVASFRRGRRASGGQPGGNRVCRPAQDVGNGVRWSGHGA